MALFARSGLAAPNSLDTLVLSKYSFIFSMSRTKWIIKGIEHKCSKQEKFTSNIT
uniref:Protein DETOXIFICATION Multidrug and toxic compound extrusion protein n=1 Tax=Rhizophora mucronata TaxID=61149 RepID=A0A2P2MA68_RHIMU